MLYILLPYFYYYIALKESFHNHLMINSLLIADYICIE